MFVQNLAPGAAARLGFSPSALRELNPSNTSLHRATFSHTLMFSTGIITLDISGYSTAQPAPINGNRTTTAEENATDYSLYKAYDLLVAAESGLCEVTGSPKEPGRVGVSVCDITAGIFL